MPGLIVFLLLGLLIAWAGGVLAVHRVLTNPPRRTYASAVARGRAGDPGELSPARAFEQWTLSSRGLSLPVWDMPGDNPAGPIIIMSHGWGDSRIGALQRLGLVLPSASRVIAWDMAGHGDAPGHSTLGTHEVTDLLALVDRLRDAERPLILLGWSLGAGVSIAAAAAGVDPTAPARVVGVIAEAPYRLARTPAWRMLGVMKWPRLGLLAPAIWLASLRAPELRRPDAFDRAALARRLKCPILVLHGERDEICPVEDGSAIASAGAQADPRSRMEAFPEAFHNDLWQNERRLAQGEAAVRVFVASVA